MSAAVGRLKRIAINAIAIGGGEVVNKASTFIVYAVVSRLSGLESFGQLALGLTLLYSFHVFGNAGLPTTMIRLIARRPKAARRYLMQGYLAGSVTSGIASLAMILMALAMQYQTLTTQVICLLALAVPCYSLAMIAEAAIKGIEKMHLVALGHLPGNLLLVGGSLTALWLGYGVLAVASVVVISRLMTLMALHLLAILAMSSQGHRYSMNIALSWRMLVRSKYFLWTDGVAAIGASLYGLMLSKFAGETEVGLLNAAFQLLQPFQIMYRSVGHSSFPPLVSVAKTSTQAVASLGHEILSLMLRLAFPACLLVFVFAGDMLDVVYGAKGFRSGAFVLQILAFSLLFDPLSPVLGHGLWAVGADSRVFRIVVVNVVVSLVLGFVLIGGYGLLGAAICGLASSAVNMVQHYVMFVRHVGNPKLMGELLRLLTAVVPALLVVALFPASPLISVFIALLLYMFIALALSPAPILAFNPFPKKIS